MRRECRPNENEIIRANMKNALVPVSQISSTNNSGKITSIILGTIVGIIIGAIVAICMEATSKGGIKAVMLIFVAIFIPLFTILFDFLGKQKAKNKLMSGNDSFYVTGGTCVGYVTEDSKMLIVYMVDDTRDDLGNPYCIKCLANDRIMAVRGERILVLTTNDGKIIPMKVTEETKNMISLARPMEFDSTNFNTIRMVPHPNAFRLDRNQNTVNEAEVQMLINTQKFVNSRSKIKYKKLVMFVEKKLEWSGSTMVEKVSLYEYENGNVVLNTYSWNINNCLPKTVKYGDLIYKYSRELDSEKKNMYWFCQIS